MKHAIASTLLACTVALVCACDRRADNTGAGAQDAARTTATTTKMPEAGRTTEPSNGTSTAGAATNTTSSSVGQVPVEPAGSDDVKTPEPEHPQKPPDKSGTTTGGEATGQRPLSDDPGPDSTTDGQTPEDPPADEPDRTETKPPEDKRPEEKPPDDKPPKGEPGTDNSQKQPPKVSGRKVARVIDGDSVALDDGNELRYIGIDAPEVDDPLHDEATEFNRKLVKGKQLIIEFDKERRDSHRRLLAYVYVAGAKEGERTFVNAEMVRNGFAWTYRIAPNDRYDDALLKAQKEARKAKKGIWKIPPPAPREKHYVSSHRSDRFHRPKCEYGGKIPKDDAETYPTRDAAFDAGKSPCRECKP
ncbi:MAG: thermonuclease family protein [Planctomycetota bacterium]|nr:thermonuclease family protein [Planctomycetota bacterium]